MACVVDNQNQIMRFVDVSCNSMSCTAKGRRSHTFSGEPTLPHPPSRRAPAQISSIRYHLAPSLTYLPNTSHTSYAPTRDSSCRRHLCHKISHCRPSSYTHLNTTPLIRTKLLQKTKCREGNNKLTHRHTSRKPTHRNNPPNHTHMRRPVPRRKLVDERTKRVEQEILDHHLQDEDFGRVGAEGVPGSPYQPKPPTS